MVIASLLAATALAAPSVSPSDLVEAVSVSGVSISPDGHMVAFRTQTPSIGDNQIRLEWNAVPADGSAPARPVADGGGPELNYGALVGQTPVWSPSSRAFYVRAGIDGEVQIWRASVDGQTARRVTSDPSDVRSLKLNPDGRALRYEVGATRDTVARAELDEHDKGVLIDGSVDVPSELLHNAVIDGHITTLRFAKDWLIRQPLLWDTDVQAKELPLGTEDLDRAPPALPHSTLEVRIETTGETQRLHAADGNGIDHICSAAPCPTEHILTAVPLENGADVLVTTRNAAMGYTLSIWTPASGRWRVLVRSKGELDNGDAIEPQSCAVGKRLIACVEADASGPPRLVSIDIADGRTRVLFDPNAALRSRTWPTRLLRWDTPSGLHVTGRLFLPESRPPLGGFPLVLDYYSCKGYLKGGVGDELPLAPLARAGIATLCINEAPGPTTSERLLEDRAIDAISSVIDLLSRQGLVDRDRIGMAGLSFGSEVMLAVAERTHLLRAAAMSSGQIEPAYYWLYGLRGEAMHSALKDFFGMGDPDTDKTGWADNAPVSKVQAIKAPLLIQIPESEMRVTMEFFSKLAASPTPTEMIAFPDEMHIKWQPRHKLAVYERNLDWFRFWLLGEEDPDVSKTTQYARWRSYSARAGLALPIKDHATPELGVR